MFSPACFTIQSEEEIKQYIKMALGRIRNTQHHGLDVMACSWQLLCLWPRILPPSPRNTAHWANTEDPEAGDTLSGGIFVYPSFLVSSSYVLKPLSHSLYF